MATPHALPASQIQTPPGPKVSLLKMLFNTGKKNTLDGLAATKKEYGDIVYNKIGPIRNYMLFSPEYVYHVLVTNQKNYIKGFGYDGFRLLAGDGLVTSDGDIWKRQRRIMSPHFTPTAVLDFSEMMIETIEHVLDRWQKAAETQQPLHMDLEMMRLTMSIIGRALFSLDLGQEPTEIALAIQEAFSFIPKRSVNPLIPMWLPLPAHRRFYRNLKVIDQFIVDQIADGRLHPERDNFLSLMLQAKDENGQGMSDKQLRDEFITLFFAGFETTARTLTWGWYMLNKHPEMMRKLQAEADQVLVNGRPGSKADLERLTYTRMVIDETLRLYPPTAMLARQNLEADEIGGYKIPAKSLISLSPYIVHRAPQYWPDPERFDPERFSVENSVGRPKAAYIPFAAGPRVCIGNSFSLLEMVYTFAMAAHRFDLKQVTPEEIPAEFTGTTHPMKPLYMQVSLRK
jgi:cytochrome P450